MDPLTPSFKSLLPLVVLLSLTFLFVSIGANAQSPVCSNPAYQTYGINFSPYEAGQDPNINPDLSAEQIRARMQVLAPCTNWVRTFSVTHGLETAGSIAHSLGLKIAAGAWLSTNAQANQDEINSLISLGQAGQADLLVVGSEVLLRNEMTDTQLIAFINQVKAAVPNVPVTTADVYGVLLTHPNVIAACDVVFPNYYPYWEGISVEQAMTAINNEHKKLTAVAGNKPIVVSEAGWPSAGNTIGNAVPSLANGSYFFVDFVSWARANNISYFYFEGFDEAWKAKYEGPQGAHWGIADQDGNLKPGYQDVFNGVTLPDNWDCNGKVDGDGTPSIPLTYVPPYGDSSHHLAGQILHVAPASYDVVVYLSANGGGTYWVKPFENQPITYAQCDGTWNTNVVTGGIDQLATNYAVFLIPSSYNPPALRNQALPSELYQNSVAHVLVSRSTNSISGTVKDPSNNAIPGASVALSGAQNEAVTTVGTDYSFYNLITSGPYTVTPSAPNYVFDPPSQSFSDVPGAVTASFVGTPATDLAVSQSVTPKGTVGLGQNVTYTIHPANSGSEPATGVILQDVLTGGVNIVSVKTDTGSCGGKQPILCQIGTLPGHSAATVTVVVKTAANGYITNSVTVTGDQPDFTPNDNKSAVTIMVGIPVPHLDQSLSPASTVPGGQSFTLTVNGTGFVPSSVVDWSGVPTSTTFVSPAQLTATISADLTATEGTAWISVVSPSAGAISNVVFFPVTNSTASLLTFGNAPGSPFNGIAPRALAVGDFNTDGKLDLAIPASLNGSSVVIRLGDGTGNFTTASSVPVGNDPVAIAVGDFNNDGKQDLAVVNEHSSSTTILLGDGTGHFSTSASIQIPDAAWIVAGDFNGDGKTDLAVTSQYQDSISILLGNGDGTFTPGTSPQYHGRFPTIITAGDFNGDGVLDLVVTDDEDNTVTILLGNGDGTFTQKGGPLGSGSAPQSVALGDFNGDGKLDLAVANTTSDSLTVLLGQGDGTFTYAPPPPLHASSPMSVVTGDVNGDGKLDLVAANYISQNVITLLGNGDGTFADTPPLSLTDYPNAIAIGDFNGDGRMDFTTGGSGVAVLLQFPSISLSQKSLSFGDQSVGTTSAPQAVTLSNAGSAPLLISGISTEGTNPADFSQTNDCGLTVVSGGVCTIAATFSPIQTGVRAASVIISDNDATTPQAIALDGTGTARLTVSTIGSGTVTSNDGHIDCGQTCSYEYGSPAQVTLMAAADPGWSFNGWTGCDSTQDNTCTVAMKDSHVVTATFTRTRYVLTLSKTGNGIVTSGDGLINCGPTCSYNYDSITQVTLTAKADQGWSFSSWTGCDSVQDNTCTVTMNSVRSVTATFSQNSYLLSVDKDGSGGIISTDGHINCGATCSYSYLSGTTVNLTATADPGWFFGSWTGCDSTTGNVCTATLNNDRNVHVIFTPYLDQPYVVLDKPSDGAYTLTGHAYNVDTTKIKVVIYVLTNEFWVQPYANAPFTNINPDGSWSSYTHSWQAIVVLLVDPEIYVPAATRISNPGLDPNVLAWTSYPSEPMSLNFSGRTWGIKLTGAGNKFDPGPNYWSNDPAVVKVADDGLHLKISQVNGVWQCGEVNLPQSLGYGTYTVQISSRLDQLDQNTVAAPLFIYASLTQELDNEYSGGGLIPPPNDAQFAVQPYYIDGNLSRYVQPATAQFTTQMEWQPDHVTFTTWNGWAVEPQPQDIIKQWTYTGSYIPSQGQEAVHINLWLYGGNAPKNGIGDEMVLHSFGFEPFGLSLTVNKVGDGNVKSGDGTIICGTMCSYNYPSGTLVTLTATPDSGWSFSNWAGCDSVQNNTCTVTMSKAYSVTATFTRIQYLLTVSKAGNGTVTSGDGHINCGQACSYNYDSGTPVTLTATPDSGWSFSNWAGCDSVQNNTCTVTMSKAYGVTATFTRIQYLLTVSKAGNGTVTSGDGHINCGQACSYNYDSGTPVTLTATPDSGWSFSNWAGCDSVQNNTCTVTMSKAYSVTATFTRIQYLLTVSKAGNGTVTSGDGHINCGQACSYNYDSGTPVSLTATPARSWAFDHWIGCDNVQNNICTVSMMGARTVTAVFVNSYSLTVSKTGSGNGIVKSTGNVINCGKVCQHAFPLQSYVMLTPLGVGGDRFDGWKSGCDSVHGMICVVLINWSRSVDASFITKEEFRTAVQTRSKTKVIAPKDGVNAGRQPKAE